MSDLFGGLSGLVKGLSGFMPKDDPDVKLMLAQGELSDLQRQETEIYVQIGKQAYETEKGRFPDLESKLKQIHTNLTEAGERLRSAQAEKDAKEAAQQAEEQMHTCAACGNVNPDGVKFCQECGAKLLPSNCRKCGAALPPGTRFCGKCGLKQER